MQTVIVPVDFSDTSLNAARYAKNLLTGHYGVDMILYHLYKNDGDKAEAISQLESLKETLSEDHVVNISTLIEKGDDFVDELERLARHRQADLIVMGITERSAMGQVFLGSNTLKISETKSCPVLIVPPACGVGEIKNVLLATDLVNVEKATPSGPIKKVLKEFHPDFYIINVNENHYIALTEEHEKERNKLAEMFAEFNPQFFFLRLYDVDEAINQFAEDKKIDLIISVQKEHSMLHKIFKSSHTKALAYHSCVPILVVHE